MPSTRDPREILRRVFLLERQQGYQDRAAVGGLENFARGQALLPGGDVLDAVELVIAGYASDSRERREVTIARGLRVLLEFQDSTNEVMPDRVEGAETGQRSHAPTLPHARETSRRRSLQVVRSADDLAQPISQRKGMRSSTVQALAKLGVVTVRDALYYLPRAHYDYTDTRSISRMRTGQKTTLVGTIQNVRTSYTRRRIAITTATVSDESGSVAVRWFNQAYLAKTLPVGARVAISGEPQMFDGRFAFQPKDYELIKETELTHAARLVPIYPLTHGLFQRSLRDLIRGLIDEYSPVVEDHLPPELLDGLGFPELSEALRQYHFPDSEESRRRAEQRLAFDELFFIQVGLLQRKAEWQTPTPGVGIKPDPTLETRFHTSLPFSLTAAQRRVMGEILADMARDVPMSRLLEGDVGSGKTVVAAAALVNAALAGQQGVLMAPTEILADQHYQTLFSLLRPMGISCRLLTGSTPKAERKELYQAVAGGFVDVLIGTHALIQDEAEFASLGVAITDEQHRFGVEQRTLLRRKGLHPHTLAMTATPIPRTLALTVYGDLDVSLIDEMPPGRVPAITTWSRTPSEAYSTVRDELRQGRQAFVICPVIDESADTDMRSVIAEHKELQSLIFPDQKVGLLHGRMKTAEKDAVLVAFRRGDCHVLVATSVVEVGIDVPNATVMVIRDAHRFGLAQLHQFRGRVGRAGDQSYCVLVSDTEGDTAQERLHALIATQNGFELAEEDLRLRGPGEFWGTRQSGLPALRVARLGDMATIERARHAAREILSEDPLLEAPNHSALREQVAQFWDETPDLA